MALLAYNKSGAALALAAGNPIITLPASGGAVDVTVSLTGLTGPNYAALEAQRVAGGTKVRYKWTKDVEFATGTLKIEEMHEDLEVADLATLTNLDDADVPDASECLVLSLGQYFRLDKSYAGAADGITVIAASVGKWLRLIAPVPKWTDQTAWYVNYGTGSDEYDGTAAVPVGGGSLVGPLKTVAEFTRRVKTAKYGTGFAGYTLNLGTDVGLYDLAAAKYRDSFQWDFSLQSTTGLMNQDQDSGITRSILSIVGTKTPVGAAKDGVIAPGGVSLNLTNAISTITRNDLLGFAVGDIVEFQAPSAAAGKRVYVMAVSGANNEVAQVNPWVFVDGAAPADNVISVAPVAGDAFKVYTLTKWGPQISGYGTQGGLRIDISQCELPGIAAPYSAPDGIPVPANLAEGDGCPDYELGGFVLRLMNCLSRISITGGIGGRVRWGRNNANSSAIIKPALIAAPGTIQNSFMTIERGDVIANSMTYVNCIIDVMNVRGITTMSRCCMLNGCIRMGLQGPTAISQTEAGPTFTRLDRISIFDVPTTVSANPFVGGAGDPGAALIMKRGAQAQVRGLLGNSVNATTCGIDISEGSSLWLQGWAAIPSTVTGALQDLKVDGGALIPQVDTATGLPANAAVLSSWGNGAGGFTEVNPGLAGFAHNLKTGTKIITVV